MSRRKRCIPTAAEVALQGPIVLDFSAQMDPTSPGLPKARNKAPRALNPDPLELRRLEGTRVAGGLLAQDARGHFLLPNGQPARASFICGNCHQPLDVCPCGGKCKLFSASCSCHEVSPKMEDPETGISGSSETDNENEKQGQRQSYHSISERD